MQSNAVTTDALTPPAEHSNDEQVKTETNSNEKDTGGFLSQLKVILLAAAKRLASLFAVYSLAYFGFSFGWIVLCVVLQCIHTERKKQRKERRKAVRQIANDEPGHVRALLTDLPSWVFFPTTERAEWLNKTINQLWPYINGMLESTLRLTVEPEIKKNMPSSLKGIHFEEINFGDESPRIGGVRVFANSSKRSEIALDLDIVYSGDAKITLATRGVKLGVEELYVRGTMRMMLGPLCSEVPLVQAISIYFVNRPEIDFNLTNLLNVLDAPGANSIIRNIIDETIASFVVLPNKINIPLVANLDNYDMKMTKPQGVLRIYLIEARNLMAKDIGIGKKSTSDPYVTISCGVEAFQSKVKYSTCDPIWREHFDMFVDDAENQSITMKLFDEDRSSRDEPLGEKNIHLQGMRSKKFSRVWLNLDKAKHGQVHIEMTWLELSLDKGNWDKENIAGSSQNNTYRDPKQFPHAALLVFIDCANNLPRGKNNASCHPLVKVSLGNTTYETRRLVNTINPVFEESFRFCVNEPEFQVVKFDVHDHKKGKSIGSCNYRLSDLIASADMSIGQPFHLSNSTSDSTLTLKLVLQSLVVPESALNDIDNEAFDSFEPLDSPMPSQTSVREGTNGLIKRSVRRSNTSPVDFKSLQKVCDIQLTLVYEAKLRKFSLIVHKLRFNDSYTIHLKDIRPYVRIYILAEHSKCQRVTTATLRNAINAVFNQAFEFDIDEKEKINNIKLDVIVKSDVSFLRKATGFKSAIAGKLIDLGDVDLQAGGPQWYQMFGKTNEGRRASFDASPQKYDPIAAETKSLCSPMKR